MAKLILVALSACTALVMPTFEATFPANCKEKTVHKCMWPPLSPLSLSLSRRQLLPSAATALAMLGTSESASAAKFSKENAPGYAEAVARKERLKAESQAKYKARVEDLAAKQAAINAAKAAAKAAK
eukprot:CAMPEP_0183352008 /NCGR_PEP_ID=MMETSP0164_2-20130417/26857_1 /TAXON_ID=221442 /ORGANISM="Coccolithus pelagicus ssp braarudi, Strain PLY182g" /LENGTH=126 /DNA_ID=CAMNT_0025524339 /DNA_START=23 /DNA_END=403 /DNA_ORIENTATION=+